MTITSDLVEAFVKCHTKCFLRSREEVGVGNAYTEWVRTQSEFFRIERIKRLLAETAPDKCATGSPNIQRFKAAQWQFAVNLTARSQNLQSSSHAVERVPSAGRGQAAQFFPIRFVFRNKLGRDDKLVLAFDAFVLSKMLGRKVGFGKIVHGDDHATVKVKTSALRGEVLKLIEKIGVLLSSPAPPDLVLNRHCPECEFQTRCRQKALQKDDLSLLSTISEKERMDFNNKGIFTVTQLSYTFRPRRRSKELRKKRERYRHSLKALAIREKKIHIIGNPELKIDGTPVYLDIEALPDRDFYYLIGVRIKVGDSVIHHSLWADSPAEEGQVWQEFLSKLIGVENPVLIHYGSFETGFLKRMREKHGGPPNGSGAAKALESPINLLSVFFGQIYFPTYSNGLKEVARWLGFRWSAQDASGVQSIMWREEWEQNKAQTLKEKLISYNLDDCAALELIARTVSQASQQDIGPNAEAKDSLEVVVAHNLNSKMTMWPKFRSSIAGFEAINRAARWDYQRQGVYIRTDGELRQAERKRKGRAKKTIRISKAVVCVPPRLCPRCQRQGSQIFRTVTKWLHDLRFSRSGVKGWVVRYQFQVFWCPACRAFTPWPKEFWDRTKYGRNLAAFCIFETIELCVSQRSVTHTLNRLFGFQMNENVVRRVKERAAEYYVETRKKLLAEIVNGNLVHADETRIRLHGKTPTSGFSVRSTKWFTFTRRRAKGA